jgi:hypothetical protein
MRAVVESEHVNNLMEDAAAECDRQAELLRQFINGEVRNPNFLTRAQEATRQLESAAEQIRNSTLDPYEEY